MKLVLQTEDLSVETLTSIKNDISRYAHLVLYRQTFKDVNAALEQRKKMHKEKAK